MERADAGVRLTYSANRAAQRSTRRADAHLFLRGTNMGKLTFILTACLLITGISFAQTYIPPPSSGSSIQFKNNGTNYGAPLSGTGSLNFSGGTVSGTSPNFTIICASSMGYPGAGIANSTGPAWGTSYSASNAIPSNFLPPPIVYNNQSNAYSAGSTQKVQSNSSAAGFQDAGSATDPPCTSALSGTFWWDTDKLLWNDCSAWTAGSHRP